VCITVRHINNKEGKQMADEYTAKCSCGWGSPSREDYRSADRLADGHIFVLIGTTGKRKVRDENGIRHEVTVSKVNLQGGWNQ